MKEYLASTEEVLREQNSDSGGLSAAEASRRLEQCGKNKLKEGKKESLIHKFLMELKDPMIIILIAAAVISGITAAYSGESFADVIIIMIVVVINAVLGVFQESKAEKAIAALQEIAAATSKVLRDGKQITVRSEELVPGDVVILGGRRCSSGGRKDSGRAPASRLRKRLSPESLCRPIRSVNLWIWRGKKISLWAIGKICATWEVR